ncbi:MAG: hypothetical protein K2I09_03525 [Duncaniella sp.]|nr:hypothetical protein [Duncaniella sp.]
MATSCLSKVFTAKDLTSLPERRSHPTFVEKITLRRRSEGTVRLPFT